MLKSSCGPIVIIGSGELSDSMAEVHRAVMARLGEPPRPVFIDTPAGFEPNVDQIAQKAVAYFRRNFAMDLAVAHYHGSDAPPAVLAAAVTAIQQANYLFAGPGSPTYAVRAWRESPVWQAVIDRWQAGAALVFASAAALTLGRFTVPVYEIYKVGMAVEWTPGLDVTDWLGSVAVVPHWNNNSGDQHDTRFCFMGADRFARLEAQLPDDTLVLGVDEYTGLWIEPISRQASVLGAGQVTLRHQGHQRVFTRGQTFALDSERAAVDAQPLAPVVAASPVNQNGAGHGDGEAPEADILALRDDVATALGQARIKEAVNGLLALSLVAGAGLEQGLPNRAERAVQALQTLLPQLATTLNSLPRSDVSVPRFEKERAALLDMLIAERTELRRAKQWAIADRLRDQLTALGYVLEDTPEGTQVRQKT